MAKVLLIDDDTDYLEVYRNVLSANGYEVFTAENGDLGLKILQAENPDLVVLDVMMRTDYEGFDVAHTIRERLNRRQLPIIMLSSIHYEKKVPYRFAPNDAYLPVDFWLDKPVAPNVLLEKIKTVLQRG